MLPVILYDNRYNDGTPTATDSASGFSILNIKDMRPYTFWKGASAGVKYLTINCGSAKSADLLGIIGHNLGTIGSNVVLQSSSDNFAADIKTVHAERVTNDKAIVKAVRVIPNGGFEVWSNGTAVAPDGWSLGGGVASIARNAANQHSGLYCAALSSAAAQAYIYIPSMPNIAYYKGKTISLGASVKFTGANNIVQLAIWDNVSGWRLSSFHTGGGASEFLTVSATINAAATQWDIYGLIQGAVTVTAYFDDFIIKEASTVAVTDFSDAIQPQSNAKQYWRLKLTAGSAAPQVAVALIGDKLQFPYPPERAYTPYAESVVAETVTGKKGHPLGTVIRYKPRKITVRFTDILRSFVSNTYAPFWDGHASDLKPFFYAEDLDNFPENVFYVKVPDDEVYRTPVSISSRVDELTLNMEGVRE